ncbi:MAG: hypothetical protein BMS9Abin29_1294 [Gemmatimonadota bacterium]|nr:MAG: hypothetical protein BMS9Abin29_1294 [Gemmatimonadota bacterium]
MAQALMAQFEQEMAGTRRALERVPFDKADWAPHEKSMTMSKLACHIAEMPGWGVSILESDEYDMNPPGGEPYAPPEVESTEELLAMFDSGVAAAKAKLPTISDEAMMSHWALLSGGQEIHGGPRGAVFNNMIIGHVIHHRGQLTVYLRLNGVPVPALYGPSADEQ